MADQRDKWTADARYFEYSKVVNPVGRQTPAVPLGEFGHRLHEEGDSRVIPLDLSKELLVPSPATSPNLCANFIRINWHAHYNESGADAHLLPIQDAGLQTHMRTLDIHFFHAQHKSFI